MLKLAYVFLKIGTLNEMAYRANFWIQVFESFLGMATALGTVAIIFSQTPNLAGWQQSELISLLGIYFMVLGAINFVIAPSLNKFMLDIVDGRLDFTLLKPRDSQLLVSISEFRIWKIIDIAMALVVFCFGLVATSRSIGPGETFMFAVSLLCAAVIIYSFWMVLATLAFWFIRIENITQIFWSMYIAGRWPVNIYPGWLKWILTLLVPVAFAVTVPAQAIAGKLATETLLFTVLLAIAFAVLSRRFWLFGIKFYSGASA
ncbi:MAG TPA: ABC transporter permease [Pseudomonadales bacterium]|nr:ABC transporter permease [Pseudomonadales bacterium]